MKSVRDSASVQAALDDVDNGSSLYFPGIGEYVGNWQVTRSLQLWGDGPGTPGAAGGTILRPADPDSALFTIVPPVRNVHIRDMELRGPGGSGSGVAIRCQSTATNATQTQGLRLRGLAIHGFRSHGIQLEGHNGGTARIARVSIADCLVELCGGAGIMLRNAFDVRVAGCLLRQNQRNGLAATSSGVALYGCVLDGNARLASWSRAANPNEGNVRLEGCDLARVDACLFLNLQEGNVQRGCVIVDCGGAMIGACYLQATGAGNRHGIVVRGAEGPVAVLSNRHHGIEKLVIVDPGVKDCVVLPQGEVTSVGAMVLPQPNEGMFGGAQVQQAAGNVLTGLIVPSSAGDPGENLREGMLAYNTTGQSLRAYINGAWRTVEVQ